MNARVAGLMFVLAVFESAARAQPCDLFTATIIDQKTGESLPGAHARKLHTLTGSTSGVDGKVELRIQPGDTLHVSFVGYADQIVLVPAECSMVVRMMASNKDLSDVVIQAERLIAEEFTYKKIRKLDIYTNPSAKADPILAVNSTPSATTTDESANISLRGSSPAETGIFLNNVPINDAVRYSQLNGIGTFSIFNTALVNNVQVYPGNPPLEFGNSTSGLIALQTDEVILSKSFNTVSMTMASMGFYTSRKLGERSSLTAFSNYQPSAIIKALNPEAMKYLTAFNSIDLGLHYFQKLDDKTALKIFTYGVRESYKYYYRQPTYQGNFNQDKIRNFTIVNLRRRLRNTELSFNTAASFSSAGYSISTIDVDVKLNDFYTSLNYQYFGGSLDAKVGISYDYKHADFRGTFPRYGYALGEQFPVDSSSSSQSMKLPEAYVYLKYFLTPKWVLGAGARKNIALNGRPDFLSSQVNLNFKPDKAFSMNLSAGGYNKYQLPQGETADPFHIAAAQYSLDVSYTKPRIETSVSLFSKQSKYIETESSVTGLEFFTRYKFSPNLRGQISLTSLRATLTREGNQTHSPYDIGYFLRGNLEYKFGGTWTITTVFLFRQGSFYIPVTSAAYDPAMNVYVPSYGTAERLPSYDIIDVSLNKLFLIREKYSAVAFASLGNMANFRNVRGYSYNYDYSQADEDLFSLRTIYFGWVVTF